MFKKMYKTKNEKINNNSLITTDMECVICKDLDNKIIHDCFICPCCKEFMCVECHYRIRNERCPCCRTPFISNNTVLYASYKFFLENELENKEKNKHIIKILYYKLASLIENSENIYCLNKLKLQYYIEGEIYYEAGNYFYELKNIEEAKKYYLLSIENKDEFLNSSVIKMINIYLLEKNTKEAIELCKKYIDIEKNYYTLKNIYPTMAIYYFNSKQYQIAFRMFMVLSVRKSAYEESNVYYKYLMKMYFQGLGVEKNIDKAYEYLLKINKMNKKNKIKILKSICE